MEAAPVTDSTPTRPAPAEVAGFLLPPRFHTAAGHVRRAGFELEFAGVSVAHAGQLVRQVFGGSVEPISTFQQKVATPVGEFQVEIDTALLKDKQYEKPLRALGLEPEKLDLRWLEEALLGTFSTVVPVEIGTPPLPITQLAPLDDLRRRLLDARAKGTRASLLYAFGLHINPELPADDPVEVRDVLRAFLLLYPWIKREAEVDLSRRISPYVNPFPDDYARLILDGDYPASRERLIDDYLRYNATRNRALDLLPVLAHLDAERVMDRVEDSHLVKPRPAYHYRLPNCMVDEPDWSLAAEWNRWVEVERLAEDPRRLAEMSRQFLARREAS